MMPFTCLLTEASRAQQQHEKWRNVNDPQASRMLRRRKMMFGASYAPHGRTPFPLGTVSSPWTRLCSASGNNRSVITEDNGSGGLVPFYKPSSKALWLKHRNAPGSHEAQVSLPPFPIGESKAKGSWFACPRSDETGKSTEFKISAAASEPALVSHHHNVMHAGLEGDVFSFATVSPKKAASTKVPRAGTQEPHCLGLNLISVPNQPDLKQVPEPSQASASEYGKQ